MAKKPSKAAKKPAKSAKPAGPRRQGDKKESPATAAPAFLGESFVDELDAQRRLIVEKLRASKRPLSVKQVQRLLKSGRPEISEALVSKHLDFLAGPASLTVRRLGNTDRFEARSVESDEDRVLAVLRSGPKTIAEISQALAMGEIDVRLVLGSLMLDGKVERVPGSEPAQYRLGHAA